MVVNHVPDPWRALNSDRTPSEKSPSAVATAHLVAIFEHVGTTSRNGTLRGSGGEVQGISARYLHHLLETSGMSFTERAVGRTARHRAPDFRHSFGRRFFRYFAFQPRLFRSRFGDPPRGVTAQRKKRE